MLISFPLHHYLKRLTHESLHCESLLATYQYESARILYYAEGREDLLIFAHIRLSAVSDLYAFLMKSNGERMELPR